jgi:hypothetical protein
MAPTRYGMKCVTRMTLPAMARCCKRAGIGGRAQTAEDVAMTSQITNHADASRAAIGLPPRSPSKGSQSGDADRKFKYRPGKVGRLSGDCCNTVAYSK